MNIRSRNRILVSLFVVIVIASLSIAATVSASHRTPMETCASHGLGPNFRYAEGSDSALVHCLDTVDTSHSISYRDALLIMGEWDQPRAAHTSISYRDALLIMGEWDQPRAARTSISYPDALLIVGR